MTQVESQRVYSQQIRALRALCALRAHCQQQAGAGGGAPAALPVGRAGGSSIKRSVVFDIDGPRSEPRCLHARWRALRATRCGSLKSLQTHVSHGRAHMVNSPMSCARRFRCCSCLDPLQL